MQTSNDDERTRLLTMINGQWMTQAIAAAAGLGLPGLMARRPQTCAELAEATGSHAASLERLLHALQSIGLCVIGQGQSQGEGEGEGEGEAFELTPLGALLDPASPGTLHAWARMRAERWADWGELEQSVRTGESYRKRHLGVDGFGRLDDDAQGAAVFHRAMVDLTTRVAAEVARVVEFRGDERLVDIGGGSGVLLTTLLASAPSSHGQVFDLPHARPSALAHIEQCGLAERCEFIAGSFFDALPPGADIYLLKSVLHNWDDERATLILSRCHAALSPGRRLLIVERLLPERWSDSATHRSAAASDLNMLVALSGRERTEAQFRSLLAAAGFRVACITATESDFHVIETLLTESE